MHEPKRPDPDVLLAQLKEQETPSRGRLRIYLGAAPGVGKTFAMLQEAHRRKSRGTDVVIGFLEPHGRPEIEELRGNLEEIPPREIEYKGVVLHEMDTDAVLARHPQVVLVDELAHTDATQEVPGSRNEKRYQDIQELLDAGITVISTLNVQHIESLRPAVEQLTGIEVHETVPDWVVEGADQIELIDVPPETLIERITEGDVFPPQQAHQALTSFFTVGNLTALRDLALRITTREVEEKLESYVDERKLEGVAIGDRIMVAIDHRPVARAVIRRGWRMAAALKGELIVVHVEPADGRRQPKNDEEQRQLLSNLQLADELGAEVVRLQGNVSEELITYARANHVSQLFLGHPSHSRWEELLRGSVTRDILRKIPGLNVHVIADRHATGG